MRRAAMLLLAAGIGLLASAVRAETAETVCSQEDSVACNQQPYCHWSVKSNRCDFADAVSDVEMKYNDVIIQLAACGRDYDEAALERALQREYQALYPDVAASEIAQLAKASADLMLSFMAFGSDLVEDEVAAARRKMSRRSCARLLQQYRALLR